MKKKLIVLMVLAILVVISNDTHAEIECEHELYQGPTRWYEGFTCPSGYRAVTTYT